MAALHRLRHLLVAVAVATIVTTALPVHSLDHAVTAFGWIGNATGLQQNWRVFAPDVRNEARWVQIDEERSDGSMLTWRLEDRRHAGAGYRGQRWRKLGEGINSNVGGRSCLLLEALADHLLDASPTTEILRVTSLSTRRADGAETVVGERIRWTSTRTQGYVVHEGEPQCA